MPYYLTFSLFVPQEGQPGLKPRPPLPRPQRTFGILEAEERSGHKLEVQSHLCSHRPGSPGQAPISLRTSASSSVKCRLQEQVVGGV